MCSTERNHAIRSVRQLCQELSDSSFMYISCTVRVLMEHFARRRHNMGPARRSKDGTQVPCRGVVVPVDTLWRVARRGGAKHVSHGSARRTDYNIMTLFGHVLFFWWFAGAFKAAISPSSILAPRSPQKHLPRPKPARRRPWLC